jgi:hypothetical protein
MDVIPLENLEPMDDNSYLSDRAIFARNKQIDRRLNRPKLRETLRDKVEAAVEMIGGVPRLALEGDENPWALYGMLERLERTEKARNINHNVRVLYAAIPPSPLDGVIDAECVDIPGDEASPRSGDDPPTQEE